MIFLNLKLNNIGLYKGKNIFNLSPNNGRNIILFGGQNGTGKTTILESVKLCLYGKNIYNYTKKEYEDFIKKLIHRDEKKGYISLEFSYFTEKGEERYKVIRGWDISEKFNEDFLIYKDDKLFTELPKEYWQDFISDLIPLSLVNLFFFDGEKIEKLAEDLSEVEFINDIKNLIGVTLIDDLYSNLSIIQKKYLKEENLPHSLLKKMEELEKKEEELENEMNKLYQDKAQINQQLRQLEKDLKTIENEFYKKGGKLFQNYEQLKIKKESLQKEAEELMNEIRNLSSSELPLAVGINLLEELISQLELESKIKKFKLEEQLLREKYLLLKELLKDIEIPEDKLNKIEEVFTKRENVEGKIIHNLTENEVQEIKSTFYNLNEFIIPNSKKIFEKLEKIEEELVRINVALENVPKEEILAPYIRKIEDLEEKKAKLVVKEKEIIENIKSLENNLKTIEREKNKITSFLSQKYKEENIIQLIEKSQRVLSKFKSEFIKKKLAILKREILEALNKLERKEKFIMDVDINPDTFEITIYDKFHHKIYLDRLSAGERQIFAVSFLWGLAKTSGKLIPVIIDTPLGRLDVTHKENFVKNYFPNVSHQVIILSTDAEIDKNLYRKIKKHISHAYRLEYNNECMCTQVKEGYFWDEELLIGVSDEV